MNRRRCHRNVPTVVTGTPEQVEAAKEEVSKYASRIHVTSIALIVVGLLALVGSIYSGLNARRGAEKWLEKAAMKKERLDARNGVNTTKPEPKAKATGPEYVTMAEFAVVDNLRMISFLAVLVSCSILGMGKQALRASWRLKAHMAGKVFRRSLMRIAFIALCALAIRHYAIESKMIVRKQVGLPMEKPHKFHKKQHHSRKLAQLDQEDSDFGDDDFVLDF